MQDFYYGFQTKYINLIVCLQGGYRIELLQEDDNVTNAVKLLPKGSAEWTGENDTT